MANHHNINLESEYKELCGTLHYLFNRLAGEIYDGNLTVIDSSTGHSRITKQQAESLLVESAYTTLPDVPCLNQHHELMLFYQEKLTQLFPVTLNEWLQNKAVKALSLFQPKKRLTLNNVN